MSDELSSISQAVGMVISI